MAGAGFCSRREAEEWIRQGRVTLNGKTATIGQSADLASDRVQVDGRPLTRPGDLVYLLLNKPTGYITTMRDPQGRPTVLELVRSCGDRVVPVGRLDCDTHGLLLLTNDGDLTFRLSHPSYEIEKVYRALVSGRPDEAAVRDLSRGIMLSDGITAPARVRLKGARGQNSVVEMGIHEGRNRQVRRMLEAVGHPVLELERVSYGPIRLGSLPSGQWRRLTVEEVEALKRCTARPAVVKLRRS
ncbi:MAG: rRNA pseudouridine synthase [Chloroflexi bacterium]|nr:rRNA pseudouridine synthase [Chloroflexota bacterium]